MHMMSLENEKRLLLLLSSYYLRTNVTKNNVLDYNSVLADCPQEKVFDFEQLIRYAKNLYK